MKKIPVRHLKDSFFEDRFSIRAIEPLVANVDLIHELHRHDFYFILFIKNGNGEHEIDFVERFYDSIYFRLLWPKRSSSHAGFTKSKQQKPLSIIRNEN